MSDQSQGPGWWIASDGKWYPPESAAPPAPPSVPPPAEPGPPPDERGRPFWKRPWVIVVAVVVVALIIAGALSGGDDKEQASTEGTTTTNADSTSTTDEVTTTTEATTTTEVAPETGTREAPHPIGTSAEVGDWIVTVLELRDGTADVMAANEFNEAPPNGSIYVLVRLRAKYAGEGEGNAGFDLTSSYVGADARVYTDPDCMAVTPDDLFDQPSVVAGGEVEGTQCLLMPASNLGTGALSVESSMSFDSDAIWWA